MLHANAIVLAAGSWGFILASAAVGLAFASHAYTENFGVANLWESSFGEPSTANVQGNIGNGSNARDVLSMILLVNTPQIIQWIGHFLYNLLLTSMMIAIDYNKYATRKNAFRVSWLTGS